MNDQDSTLEAWRGKVADPRPGIYEYKNVRFRLTRLPQGWSFQPFGGDVREFVSWEDAVAGLEETCTAIAQHRTARRNR